MYRKFGLRGQLPLSPEVAEKIALLKCVHDNPGASHSARKALEGLIALTRRHQTRLMELHQVLCEASLPRSADAVLIALIDSTNSFDAVWLHWKEIGDRGEIALYALRKFLPTIRDKQLLEALMRQYGLLNKEAGVLIMERLEALESQSRP